MKNKNVFSYSRGLIIVQVIFLIHLNIFLMYEKVLKTIILINKNSFQGHNVTLKVKLHSFPI